MPAGLTSGHLMGVASLLTDLTCRSQCYRCYCQVLHFWQMFPAGLNLQTLHLFSVSHSKITEFVLVLWKPFTTYDTTRVLQALCSNLVVSLKQITALPGLFGNSTNDIFQPRFQDVRGFLSTLKLKRFLVLLDFYTSEIVLNHFLVTPSTMPLVWHFSLCIWYIFAVTSSISSQECHNPDSYVLRFSHFFSGIANNVRLLSVGWQILAATFATGERFCCRLSVDLTLVTYVSGLIWFLL